MRLVNLLILLLVIVASIASIATPTNAANPALQSGDNVALAYIKNNVVTLADWQGNPLASPGPELSQWQSARLFWSPDGASLYTATRQGLFVTGALGGAAVRLPGEFGLTVAIARHGGVLYNIDTDNPQNISEGVVAFPLRETNIANMEGGRGRLLSVIGAYQANTANAAVTHAAAVYARDGGLLEGGRPQIYATYGGNLFFTCCFPDAGLGLVDPGTTETYTYDRTFVTGAAAINSTASRLIAPTTEGIIRTIDLITAGTRDYFMDVTVGQIERMAWGIDETAVYFISREAPTTSLEVLPEVTYPVDTRSAYLILWELNLITGRARQVATFGDNFGVSSMTATDEYVFAVVVERNEQLVNAFNNGTLPPNIATNDPILDGYVPRSILWRVEIASGQMFAIDENVWGVVARPD